MKFTTLLAGAFAALAIAAPAPEAKPEPATTALEERAGRFASQAGRLNSLQFRNDDLCYLFNINNNVFGNLQLFQQLALEQQFNALAFSPFFNAGAFNIQSLLRLQVMHTLFFLFSSGVVPLNSINFAAFNPSVLNLGFVNGDRFSGFDLATLIEAENLGRIQGVLQNGRFKPLSTIVTRWLTRIVRAVPIF